ITILLFPDTSPTSTFTLSLHDALPIYHRRGEDRLSRGIEQRLAPPAFRGLLRHDRVRVVPVPDRAAEPSHPGRDRAGLHRDAPRSEEHTSELQSLRHLVCRLLLEKKKT